MKTKHTLIILLALLSDSYILSQVTEYKKFPVNVSFVYPIALHGFQSVNYEYDFSLNMLTGTTGSINGFEIGGLLNTNKGNISGLQLGGIGNNTWGYVDGAQIGGIYSLADSVDGMQMSGIFSKCSESDGLQISGIANFSTSSVASIAGIVNINTGNQDGIQLAGIFNQAKEVNGVQIGLINIADTIKNGIPIGLISLVKKGHYDEWSFSIADYLNLGISYKLGVKQFYTIYTVGMNLVEDQLWVAGLGFGHLSEVNPKLSIQPEVICYTYFPMDFQGRIRDTYIYHFKFGLVRNLSERMAISFAPSIYLAQKSNRRTYEQYGYEQSLVGPLFDVDRIDHTRLECGFGLSIALHFR
jgi:hypothetical protein